MNIFLNDNSKIELTWESGTKVICKCFTIYESDNNLEIDNPNYEEFLGIAIDILQIVKSGAELLNISEDNILEINHHNVPQYWRKID